MVPEHQASENHALVRQNADVLDVVGCVFEMEEGEVDQVGVLVRADAFTGAGPDDPDSIPVSLKPGVIEGKSNLPLDPELHRALRLVHQQLRRRGQLFVDWPRID